MPVYNLEDLLKAVDGVADQQWSNAIHDVADARNKISNYIDSGGVAYGFSTYLGHLDKYVLSDNTQQHVLDAHLVGSPKSISAEIVKAITAVKICQLSHAKNGISLESYRVLIERFEALSSAYIDLDASYGSGDVVPASWWAKAVFPDDHVYYYGDVIALINGQFVATGLLLGNFKSFREVVESSLQALCRAKQLLSETDVQLPVSLRDLSPLTRFAKRVISALSGVLVDAVNMPSGNPLFSVDKQTRQVSAQSNASFLNFELANSIEAYQRLLTMLSAYLRSATWWLCSQLASRQGELIHGAYFVQPPKVSKVYCDRVNSILSPGFSNSQSESHFIEDIGDNALILMRKSEEAVVVLHEQLMILEKTIESVTGEPGRARAFYEK